MWFFKKTPSTPPPSIPQENILLREMKEAMRNNISDSIVAAAYSTIYTRVSQSRRKLIREVERMRQFYLVDVILTQLTEDALTPEITTGDIVEVTSPKKEIQYEIDYLEEKFDLDQLILTITPDLLAYGEYTLATQVNVNPNASNLYESKTEYGLIELLDNLDQSSVIALSRYSAIDGYLILDEHGQIKKRLPCDFVKFTLLSQRLRIDIHQEFGIVTPKLSREVPRFIRVGRSVIYSVLSKLKELELIEALVPATKISKLSSGSLIGIQVPAGYEIDKALDAAKKVESLINKKMGIDPKLEELTIENIMNAAGRLKVVPIFGDKGTLSKLDYKSEEPEELLSSIVDIRKTILSSVGIPYEVLFGGEETKRGEIIRKFGRYLRKLKAIQKSLEEGLRQIIYIHLVNKGIPFTSEDIRVEFYNKIVDMESLDRLEYIDTTVAILKNIDEFMEKLSSYEGVKDAINFREYMRFLNNELNIVGFNEIINVEKLKEVEKSMGEEPEVVEEPVELEMPVEEKSEHIDTP